MNGAAALARGLLEVVFPPRCAACDAIGREPFCRTCAASIDPAGALVHVEADWSWAEFDYGGPVAEAIRRFKYGDRPELGRPLGELLVRSVAAAPLRFERVVPVPTTPARLRERGFNPARELARGFGRAVTPRALHRRPGPSQVGQSRDERQSNLAGVFDADPRAVLDRSVLVVDDVITTGATASAIVTELRRRGAKRVGFVAVARTR